MHPLRRRCQAALTATNLYRAAALLWVTSFAVASYAAAQKRAELHTLTPVLVGTAATALVIAEYRRTLVACDEVRRIAWWSGAATSCGNAPSGLPLNFTTKKAAPAN